VDLCAGTLDCTAATLRRFPQSEILAVDFSQEMLDHGLSKVPHVFQNHVSIQCGDVLEMDLPQRSVDVVLCAYGMRNIADQTEILKKIQGWLAPDGELIILEFFKPKGRMSRIFSNTYSKYILPAVGGLVSGDSNAYKYLHDSIQDFYSLSAYRALLAQCGFHVIRNEELTGGITSLVVATPIL
jgi:demethylmenaquinone methyltransferase/2-methoxy-6-polyprenyl-1,4-benzoquinol methylase